MKQCKNCTHWTRLTDSSAEYHGAWMGDCSCPKFTYSGAGDKVKADKDGLEYYDYEGYSAGFYTGENFCCIHHEKA